MRHFSSRKFLGFLITAGLLTGAALVVSPDRYAALATALVALYGAFAATNTVAGHLGARGGSQ